MLPIGANLDLLIVPQRLEVAGFDVRHATEFFGYLTGMAVPLVNLAAIFTAAMTISLVPAISESRALEDFKSIRDKIRLGFRAAMIINFPCFVGLFFLDCVKIYFRQRKTKEATGIVLNTLALCKK